MARACRPTSSRRSALSPAVRICCRAAAWRRRPALPPTRARQGGTRGKRKLVPYYDRAAIEDGVLDGRDLEICWLKDPIDVVLHPDPGLGARAARRRQLMRAELRRRTTAIPTTPVGRCADRPQASCPRTRCRWTASANGWSAIPTEAEELRRQNKSYVFFRIPACRRRGADRRAGHVADAGPLDRGRPQAARLRHAVLHLGRSADRRARSPTPGSAG